MYRYTRRSVIKCSSSTLEVLLSAINHFMPIFFPNKIKCSLGHTDPTWEMCTGLINDPDVIAYNSLLDIWGVGKVSAAKLLLWGIRSPADILRDREVLKSLNHAQRVGLKHIDDFKKKIPRSEVELIGDTVRDVVNEVGKGKLRTQLCGSFR